MNFLSKSKLSNTKKIFCLIQSNNRLFTLLITKNILKTNYKYLIKCNRFNFCEKINSNSTTNQEANTNTENNSQNRYLYEFESPETQDVNLKSATEKYSYILLKLIILSFGIYFILLKKYNPISKHRELYFINEYSECKFFDFVTKKIIKRYQHYIFKQDSEECEKVYNICKNLIEKNNLPTGFIKKEQIYIIDSPSIGALLSKNGDLLISYRVLELSNQLDDEIAFFVAFELAHVLMGKSSYRFFKIIKENMNLKIKLASKKFKKEEIYQNFLTKKFEELSLDNRFLYFYPESKISNYYEEIEIARVALNLLYKAGYNLDKVIYIYFNI
jgi:hypothetical protein